jgi:hypothetical protein
MAGFLEGGLYAETAVGLEFDTSPLEFTPQLPRTWAQASTRGQSQELKSPLGVGFSICIVANQIPQL